MTLPAHDPCILDVMHCSQGQQQLATDCIDLRRTRVSPYDRTALISCEPCETTRPQDTDLMQTHVSPCPE